MTLRVLIAVTHLLGAGHLTRAAAIGRALARRGHAVTLVSGGTPAPLVDTAGLDLVQLPPVRAAVDDFTTLRTADGVPIGPEHLAARRQTLLATLASAGPDVVVTELFPFGRRVLWDEFSDLIARAEETVPRPLIVASVRDILAPPSRPAKAVTTRETVLRHYDAVLVHGDEAFLPLDLSWPVDDALRRRLVYTGYVGPDRTPPAAGHRGSEDGPVLVSGGSSAAALPLYRAAVAAAGRDGGRPWHVLLGAGVSEADHRALTLACSPNVTVERARADFRDLLRKAAVFVGQAGYNTVMDIVATQTRSVLVPFERGRETEQRMRADRLHALGLTTRLPESELDPDTLLRVVRAAALRSRPDVAAIRLDGAEATALCIEDRARGGRLAPSRVSP